MLRLKLHRASLRRQETDYPCRADCLGDDGCQRRALHPHIQHKDQDRIQANIEQRSDHHRQHGNLRLSLPADERIQTHCDLNEYCTDQIDTDITLGIPDRHFTGTKRV